MLNSIDFVKCIRDNLKDRRFGKERADKIVADFEGHYARYQAEGKSGSDAGVLAMRDTFDNLSRVASEKAKRTAKMLSVQAENMARIDQALTMDASKFGVKGVFGKNSSRGVAVGRAAVSLIEDDPRFSGLSFSTRKEVARGQLFATFADVIETAGKGAFGRQRGKAHLPNIAREVLGENTGDAAAKEMALAWRKTENLGVDMFNQAGGSMTRLTGGYLPHAANNIAKLNKAGAEAAWKRTRADRWDWDRMRWPDGSPIAPADRPSVVDFVFETMSSDGANKTDVNALRGRGRAVGNQMENHRFVHYKDAQSWLDDLEEYGDGNVFDVMVRHIEDLAHRVALVDTFGPNPELIVKNVEAVVRKKTSELSAKDRRDAEDIMNTRFNPMMDVVMRTNPMNPDSVWGAGVVGTGNILTAAQLGSAAVLAIPGDAMQTMAVRALNGQGLFDGVDTYFKTALTDRNFMQGMAAQSGFIMDEVVNAVYATTRFSGVTTLGPAVTRRVADTVMRLSFMSGHTRSARWASQFETMGWMNRHVGDSFDKAPFREVMERYGISAKEWDAFRKGVKAHEPKPGVQFLRPIDILETNIPNKDVLYKKFQGMVLEESRRMVPEATIESAIALKGTTRPDNLAGTILHSFAMYKNFPVSFAMIYGRLALTSPTVKGRIGFLAALAAGMTMVGAVGTQMREVAKGNDPLPMNTPEFLGKAMLSGGALSIWGDFLFSGVNSFGSGPQDVAAGPLVGWLGDTTQLALGDLSSLAQGVGSLGEGEIDVQAPAKLVEYMRRYTPGTNIWWSRLAFERYLWDNLQDLADPKAAVKRRRKAANQRRNYGTESWWPAGQLAPERAPIYEGRE